MLQIIRLNYTVSYIFHVTVLTRDGKTVPVDFINETNIVSCETAVLWLKCHVYDSDSESAFY